MGVDDNTTNERRRGPKNFQIQSRITFSHKN